MNSGIRLPRDTRAHRQFPGEALAPLHPATSYCGTRTRTLNTRARTWRVANYTIPQSARASIARGPVRYGRAGDGDRLVPARPAVARQPGTDGRVGRARTGHPAVLS